MLGAERVEAQRLSLGDVRYRYREGGTIMYGGPGTVVFDVEPLTPAILRESLERNAAEIDACPPSIRAMFSRPTPRPSPPEPKHAAPWWYRLASRFLPARCREVPEARSPERTLLRQAALVLRWAYLQGFASGEDPEWYHGHGRWLLVVGLWGGYRELRPGQPPRTRRAPYAFLMAPGELHAVDAPTRGHTSLAVFLSKGQRFYVRRSEVRGWREHVQVEVRSV
jgi:hypothetical protein